MHLRTTPILLLTLLIATTGGNRGRNRIDTVRLGTTGDGAAIYQYTLTNTNGLKAEILNYGGALRALYVPDRNGTLADIVLGFDDFESYVKPNPHFGTLIGRYANRIGGARFTLDGVEYALAKNNGPNHLHGGLKGFDHVIWDAKAVTTAEGPALKLKYRSTDGEEGYPGDLEVTVTYALTDNDELKITYQAETDKTTVVNLTNHSYFNLAGVGSGDILGHVLTLNADNYTPVDTGLIPTGEIRPVKDSPMDFTKPQAIGSRIAQVPGGYDHNYCINNPDGSLRLAATVYEPTTGRVMEVLTTQPGIQFYTGNFLNGTVRGKGTVYEKHAGFCLETQHYPDSPNKPNFPSTVLKPGQRYEQITVYRFSVRQ